MKHLKKYNTYESVGSDFEIGDFFLHTFDLCDGYEISEAYFDTSSKAERNWASNDFSNDNTTCQQGFDISIEHSFYDKTDIKDFEKYVRLMNQLLEDVKRFKEMYKPKDIFFEEGSNTEIHILIQP